MSIIIYVAFLFLPVLYIHFELIKRWTDFILAWLGCNVEGTILLSNMTSLIEVSVGLNLALSILTSFSKAIGTSFTRAVKEYDPEKNPTFLEAMKEAADANGKELGAELNQNHLQNKYISEVEQQIADFEADIRLSESKMKSLGIFAALAAFLLLSTSATHPGFAYPNSLFYIATAGSILPICVHVLTLLVQIHSYNIKVKATGLQRTGMSAYEAYIRDVHQIYNKKKLILDKNLSISDKNR